MAITFQDLLNNVNANTSILSSTNSVVYVYITSKVTLPYEEGMTIEALFNKHADSLDIDVSSITDYKVIENDTFNSIDKFSLVVEGKTYSIRRSLDDKGLF